MTRENKLPILRQGSRTCETKNKGGQEGGELDDGKNNGETIELEMRGAMRIDKLGAGLSKKDNEEGISEVGTITKIKRKTITKIKRSMAGWRPVRWGRALAGKVSPWRKARLCGV